MHLPVPYKNWRQLIKRVLKDDESASDALADVLSKPSFRYFRRFLSKEDAEDLSQDFVVRIFTVLHQFKGGSLRAWAYSIMRTMLMDRFRTLRRHLPPPPPPESFPEISQPEIYDDEHFTPAETNAFERALDHLNTADRALIESQWGSQSYSLSDVGKEHGISATNARVRHFRALQDLAKHLRDEPAMSDWFARHLAKLLGKRAVKKP